MKTIGTYLHISLPKSINGYSSKSSTSPSSPTAISLPHIHNKTCSSSINRPPSFRSKSFNNNNNLFVNILLRRNFRLLLVIPLFYISVLFICFGVFSPIFRSPPLPGSVYRSPEIFNNLWPQIQSDNASAIQLSSVWSDRRLTEQKPCLNITRKRTGFAEPSGYLIVEANGGLNQQRSSICNAVAVAWLLNAILVIPQFNLHNIWKDPSQFGDIYDENHFKEILEGYVTVVRKLPEDLLEKYEYNISNVLNVGVRAWTRVSYYQQEVYPILLKERVIRIAPFANRLAMEVPPSIQFLRCLTNYKALRFSDPIATIAKTLVDRMIEKSSKTSGKYVSVHLRFEEDMVAFSCCVYDGGAIEKFEMDFAREKGWGDKFTRKEYIIKPGQNRISGRCPLTPLEVGMMLRGMGFDSNTSIYLASGKIYQAKRNLAPLLKMFPMVQTKESLLAPDELASFEGYSSRLAALDYTMCLSSEVFVTTQGGNFPHFLIGHRRFLYGHAKTIKPDKRKLVLLLQDTTISWETFKNQMEKMLLKNDVEGRMVPKVMKASRHYPIFMYPSQECMCFQGSTNSTRESTHTITSALDQQHKTMT
ncbi:O-fucosyltransferase [Thalictrum thalictroides]|uniref:O-fucosyltransferase family protein n=1 Tax=Thalictrum thalictroides TaxID=46969 RepID=A0A7J6VC41_THATH|nr:O-fucosyltransferase [Thalictrum thalictroides]